MRVNPGFLRRGYLKKQSQFSKGWNDAKLVMIKIYGDLKVPGRLKTKPIGEHRGFCLVASLGQSVQKTGDFSRQAETWNRPRHAKTAFLADQQIAPRGFESACGGQAPACFTRRRRDLLLDINYSEIPCLVRFSRISPFFLQKHNQEIPQYAVVWIDRWFVRPLCLLSGAQPNAGLSRLLCRHIVYFSPVIRKHLPLKVSPAK